MASVFVISADFPVAFEFSSDSKQDVETFVMEAMRESRVISLQVGEHTILINFGGVRQAMVASGDDEDITAKLTGEPVVPATLEDMRRSE